MQTSGIDSTAAFDPTAASPRDAADLPFPAGTPEQVGGYRLIRTLGAGGMGAVYEAEEMASGRRVALKLIAPQFASSPEAVERFRQEGRLASGIVHPRCVFVAAAEEEAGRPYIVMELMPGTTLKDLVEERGPLDLAEAVARILDVIDGLREAHRLAVIHRDVKPSNCFLDGEDRVKIGDFGLSKSLVADVQLTQTGRFLGTLLFASPEQIRGEPIDLQTDVYSVAATLYYLLTGHAPFEAGDAAATLAKIVADPPTPLRSLRPDVPKGLEAAVLRGLARQRPRRWKTLDELREALLPYASSQRAPAPRGLRVAAYLFDTLLFVPLDIFNESQLLPGWLGFTEATWPARLVENLVSHVPLLIYFVVCEGLWGASLGKWLLRLRVDGDWAEPPGIPRALLRTLLFVSLLLAAPAILDVAFGAFDADDLRVWDGLYLLAFVVGGLAIFSTARASNGYRGLHELASGTRVIAMPWPSRGGVLSQIEKFQGQSLAPATIPLPDRVGPYAVRGVLGWQPESGGVLVGEDHALGRKVWITVHWGRPLQPALDSARRELSRPARLRWLCSGQLSLVSAQTTSNAVTEAGWDAYVAPAGCPLLELAARGVAFHWSDLRPILKQLTDELAAALDDGTLPAVLTPEQVWLQPNGQVHLLDRPLPESAAYEVPASMISDEERALSFLRQVALICLEGRPSAAVAGKPSGRRQAPAPQHASALLAGLLSAERPYQRVSQLQGDLQATRGRPSRVTTGMRAGQLAVQAALLSFGLLPMFGLGLGFNGFLMYGFSEELRANQQSLHLLEENRLPEFVYRQMQPGETVEADLQAAGRYYQRADRQEVLAILADPQIKTSLQDAASIHRTEMQRRIKHASWLDRALWRAEYRQAKALLDQQTAPPAEDFTIDDLLSAASTAHMPPAFLMGFVTLAIGLAICFFGALWSCWPLLIGPGWSYRMVGLALVRRDGRAANRLQCAWRALLIWGPITVLLLMSVIVQAAAPELTVLASALIWISLLLLPGYFIIALWFPDRAPHDVLAGTWLVPR